MTYMWVYTLVLSKFPINWMKLKHLGPLFIICSKCNIQSKDDSLLINYTINIHNMFRNAIQKEWVYVKSKPCGVNGCLFDGQFNIQSI